MKIIIGFLCLSFVGCTTLRKAKPIKEKDALTLHVLNSHEADTLEVGKMYIRNREVLDTIELIGEQRSKFLEEFENEKNYEPITRKCELNPVYSLFVNDNLYALFDVEYCPTIEYVHKRKKSKFEGIITNNGLKEILSQY